MIRNPYFLLRELAGEPYLLPFGQSIASHQRGVRLNESGVFLWNCLEQPKSYDELLQLFAEHYEANAEELSSLSADLRSYVDVLLRQGAILSGDDPWAISAPFYQNMEIAGLFLRLEGPAEVYSDQFAPFYANSASTRDGADMVVTAFAGICPYKNPGKIILRDSLLTIIDCGDYYECMLHANTQVTSMILKKDGRKVIFYYSLPHNELLRQELFHGIREAFLYVAGLHGMAALHSTSILYRGKAWLFSGHSGMGKSTHAALWRDTLNVPILNGDLNLLGYDGEKPVIYGIPWCGTSGIFDRETHPLGGIVLLKRDSRNHTEDLSPDLQLLLVDQRLISHSFTEELFDANLKLIQKIAPELLICCLYCTKDPEAASVMQKKIDLWLS